MFELEWIAAFGVGYLVVLFLIAYLGDSQARAVPLRRSRNVIYALSLAVYCSSWTFYGAVGTAAVRGLDYLAIYLGPILVFMFGYPLMRRVILICKQNNITTISDFIASRFAKSRRIGVLVTFIAVVGSLPYIALQLHAVSQTYLLLHQQSGAVQSFDANAVALYTGIVLALFAVLFGTRHLDATEQHSGMVLAIAFESIIKLAAILIIGFYAYYLLLESTSLGSFEEIVRSAVEVAGSQENASTWVSFLTRTVLAMAAIVLLPRQFQVTVVEAESHEQFKTAAWLMPIYLLLTSLIVIPIALAGTSLLPLGQADMYVLNLPLLADNSTLGLIAFIGGLSAATGMVIVAVISLSTMICNDWVMPNLIRLKSFDVLASGRLDQIILLVRRLAIVFLLSGAYVYFLLMDNNAQLANIGLVSFAAVIQFLPALLCALYWQRAHSKGVFWGLVGGFSVWVYTLLLPTILTDQLVDNLLGANAWLHPQRLFSLDFGDSLAHGVMWSLLVNIVVLIVVSIREQQSTLESMQANRFYNINSLHADEPRTRQSTAVMVHPDTLRILAERVIGVKNTEKIFTEYQQRSGENIATATQIDGQLLSLVQTAIAGVIGTTSAQRVIADTITGNDQYLEEITTLVDASSSLLRFNRKLLETTLQNITHGISVVDEDLNLVVWNERYLQLFDYPETLVYVGKPIRELLEYNAERGDFHGKDPRREIRKRLKYLQQREPYQSVRKRPNGVTIKSTGEPMPGGGFVTTYEDITESVTASELLRKANEELELRVRQRTRELEVLTEELERNTRSKTHFLAAASHDLLQPINAARLFTQSIKERQSSPEEVSRLAGSVDESLKTANQLLRALLDVSKLDAGGIQPELRHFELRKFVIGLIREFDPVATDAGVIIEFDLQENWLYSDPDLLLSVMQNLVGNAIRYTPAGGQVLIHTRKSDQSDALVVCVTDTGSGIAQDHLDKIFNEFYRVKSAAAASSAAGLGLGLSIVRRICRLLDLPVKVESNMGEGSTFSVTVPLGEKPDSSASTVVRSRIQAPADRLRGLRVLCVENDANVLNSMQTLLTDWGCEVACFSGYKEAWEHYQGQGCEILLADYRLDFAETGLDLLRAVKQHAEQSGEPAAVPGGVLITAEQDLELKDRVTRLGFHFLAKPVEPAALKSMILYLLGQT